MLKASKILPGVATVALLGIIGYGIFISWRSMKESGYQSCLASMMGPIVMQKALDKTEEQSDSWRILGDEELEQVMSSVRPTDCAPSDDRKLDIWNNKIHIALRKNNKGNWPHIMIWSNGRDGIENTSDDLIVPYGEKIPR